MSDLNREIRRVLAVHPAGRTFGYAVLEGPERLIDWGTRRARKVSNPWCLVQVAALIDQYHLDLVVVEDGAAKGCRRSARVRDLLRQIRRLARKKRLLAHAVSRRAVQRAFESTARVTKHRIASRIAEWFPELGSKLPPPRKLWMAEHHNMQIFDAVALGLTFFDNEKRMNLS